MSSKRVEFEKEIESQLPDDFLSYSWLVMMSADFFPNLGFEERAKLLIEALTEVGKRKKLVVGPTRSVDSVVQIEPLGEDFEDSMKKFAEFVQEKGDPSENQDVGFLVWVGLDAESDNI